MPLLPRLLLASCLVSIAVTAHEPPTDEQIAELKRLGRLESTMEFAHELADAQVSAELVQAGMMKIKAAQMQALGASEQQIEEAINALASPPPAAGAQLPVRMRGTPSTGSVRNLTLLIDFADIRADTTYPNLTLPKLEANIYGTGTEVGKRNAPFDSLAAYYARASHNKLDIKGKILGWFNMPDNRETYESAVTGVAATDSAAKNRAIFEVISTALRAYDEQEDFSVYDNDNDGYIDNIDIIWTGTNGAWLSFWWPIQWRFFVPESQNFTVDGKRLRVFSWQGLKLRENNSDFNPSTMIHEFGHVLGVPDLYDYKRTQLIGPKGGCGGLDIMDSNWGNMNGFFRWLLGWIQPQIIAAGEPRMVTLAAGGTPSDANKAVVVFPNAGANAFQEFFLLENRHRVGNDGGVARMPNDGLIIWHVDAALNQWNSAFLSSNHNGNRTSGAGGKKLVRLVQADSLNQIETHSWTAANGTTNYGGRADAGDYYGPGASFGPATTPASNNYAGNATSVIVDTISNPGLEMMARVGFLSAPAAQPDVQPGAVEQQTISASTVPVGSNVNIQASIDNEGSGSAPAFRVRIYASLDDVLRRDEDLELGFEDIGGVSAAAGTSFAKTLPIPVGTPPGTYRIGWIIDSEGAVPELEENDNVFLLPDPLIITGPLLPEIVVEGLEDVIEDGSTLISADAGTLAGPARVGKSDDLVFLIRNAGAEVLTLGTGAVSISGTGAAHFNVIAQPPTTLPPGASAPFVVRFAPSTAGLHRVEIGISSDDFNESAYNFHVDGRALDATDDHADDVASATLLPLATPTAGGIDLGGDVDVFAIQIASAGQLVVSSTGTADTAAALLTATGDLIVFNDDFGSSRAFTLATNVTPGTYYLVVSGSTAESSGSYSLSAVLSAAGGPDDHGNVLASATVMTPGAMEAGRIDYAGDLDVFRLTLASPGTLQLQSEGETDVALTLMDQTGAVLTSADNGADHENFLLRQFLPAGTYYAELRGGTPAAVGGYGFLTSLIPGTPPDDHGNALATATATSTDGLVLGTFEQSGDVDVFRVVLPSAGRLAMHSGGPLDPNLELRDSGGALLISDADSGPGDNFQAVTLLSAGTYYLHLSGFNASLSGSYRLHTNFTPNAATLADDHSELPDAGTALSEGIGSAVAGNLSTAGDTDFFRITITQSGFLQVLTTGSADTDGSLFDSSGIQVLSDDDSGAGSNFLLPLAVTPGTYYARVRGYQGTATGAYWIHFTFTAGAVPDDHLDTLATTSNPALPGNASGVLNFGGDVDVFRITVAGPGHLRAFTQGLTDTLGELWNANGDIIRSADDASDTNANFDFTTSVSPGTYYLAVRGYDFAITGAYTLNLDFTGTAAVAPVIALSSAAVTVPLAANGSDQGSFDLRNSGGGTLNYTLTASAPWIHLSSTTGSNTGEWDVIRFGIDADELPAGVTSVGSIQITALGATTRTVLVSAIVAASIPALPQPQLTLAPGGTSLQVQWAGQSGRIMHLEVSDTLAPGSWVRVPDAITVGGAGANVTLPISGGVTKRFYRLVLDN